MSEVMIDIQAISLERGDQIVLHEISVQIFRGEVLVVLGASGSGKSSLLRCINRLSPIQSGKILFKGDDILTLPILELRQKIGIVFQKTAAFAGTVADNISYGPQLNGIDLSETQIQALMQQAVLDPDLILRDAKSLSGGQEQRLSIARALANRPAVLLLDEPTSALDPVATHKIEEILLKLRDDDDLTLIWVSHSVEQARRVADRILFLDQGHVVRCGTVNAMLDEKQGDARILAFARGQDDNLEQERE